MGTKLKGSVAGNGGLWVWVVVLGILVGSGVCVFGDTGGAELTLGQDNSGEPFFHAKMDAAGYSDAFYYGFSDIHPHSSHELLSGEWGAAIYYDGIDTVLIDPANPSLGRKAMWLTREFEFPYWWTYTRFSTYGTYGAWPDNNNPTPGPDTGQSVIRNGKVEITIDYEVVDLEFLNPLYYPIRSPMSYLDPQTGEPRYMPSDRYCFLQTYTFRNIDPGQQPLANVAFYQMLHSHGADEYNATVSSTYSTVNLEDPFQYYTPRNPVHQVGNFRYDITQWNGRPFGRADHVDFNGFSSVVEPDWVDNDLYEGGHFTADYKPPVGTHIHIENRALNNVDRLYQSEVAGAMGWNLGTLDPNETTSITVAVMWGQEQEIVSPILLAKTDDIGEGCVGPGDAITYTICWNNVTLTDADDAVLIDYLPKGVDYPQAEWTVGPNWEWIPPDTAYDAATHSYQWDIGTIAAGATGCVELTVTVNERAEPGMAITNLARLSTENLGVSEASHDTRICCWGGDVIYVDPSATGLGNGTSWTDAYTDLQSALTRARESTCTTVDEIRVARGEYDPGREAGDTFAIPPGVSVYGGYRGGAINPDDRRPKEFVTTLTGAGDNVTRNETIVTMGDNTLLDGVTVRDAAFPGQGILADSVTYTLSNCVVEDNLQYGIRGIGCDATIQWSTIQGNQYHGIIQDGMGNTIKIENCRIQDNLQYGIYLKNSTTSSVKNSNICRNGTSDNFHYGIFIENPKAVPNLHNNTIAYNRNAGIGYIDNEPNYPNQPDIQNCILWYNNQTGNGLQQAGYISPTHYSCVYDPNDPTGISTTLDANYNFSHKPDFAYGEDPNNVHLAAGSFCINKGNPGLTYTGQQDIDGEDRVMGGVVDVGADEVNPECNDVYHPLDWNADGVVNMEEFYWISKMWLTHDPNDPQMPSGVDPNDFVHWNPRCDLDDDYDVDLADLVIFAEDNPKNWLWVACWRLDLQAEALEQMMMSMAPASGVLMQPLSVSSALEPMTVVFEKPIQEQIYDLKDTIQFLEKLWLEDQSIQNEIDPAEWQQFMDEVYNSFNEMILNSKTFDLPEELQ